MSTATLILEASLEVRGAIVFATLIIVLAVVPVFFMESVAGAFFRPLATSYALALLASMAVALTVTPALGLLLLSKAPLEWRQSPLVGWLQRGYEGALVRIIRRPRAAYAAVVVFVVVGLAVLPFLGQELFPAFKERDLVIRWEGAPGTSQPEMVRITTRVSRELQAIPGVRNVNAHVGRAVLGDQIVGIHSARLWVSLDPQADYDATLAAIRETVDGYPGLVRDVQTYLQELIRQVLTGSDRAVVVRVFGPDFAALPNLAEKGRQRLAEIDGVVDLHMESQVEEPHVEIEVDLAKAARYGLNPGDVRRAAAVFVAGLGVGDIFKEKKVFEVMVWAIPQARHSLTSLRELLIDTPGGGQVRLGDVAEVRVAPTLTVIRHEAYAPYLDVGFNVRGRDLGAVVRDVEQALREIAFPLEYHPEVLGEYAERQAAQQRILAVAVVAVIGIFLLLQTAFDNWRLAFLAFLALPAALVGGVLAVGLSGGILSIGSLVGFLTVLGIAVRNGILLINHYQHLEQQEGETFGPGLVVRGARERLAPILMTAFTVGLALVPFALFGNIPGHEIEHPMAIIILGGLVTATLLNLFIMPALYLRFGRSSPEPGMSI
jgi:Cu/Ag efflux pump CusA